MCTEENFTTDPELLAREVEIEFIKSSGPGGRHRDTSQTGVRITHPPSGISVTCTDTRSQAENRSIALERLRQKLENLNKPEKERKKTKPTRSSKQKRRRHKRIRREKKHLREKIEPDEHTF